MLRISKKADRTIIILTHLAEHSDRYCSAREIACRFEMARTVIANTLKMLAKAGLVRSELGYHGGYQLAKAPSQIKLSDLLKAIGESFVFARCVEVEPNGDMICCKLSGKCPAELTVRYVHQEIHKILDRVTVAHIAGDFMSQVVKPSREAIQV